MPLAQKTAKAKPNILRKQCNIADPTRKSNKKDEVSQTFESAKSAKSFIQKIVDSSNTDDAEVYILDQSDFSNFFLENLDSENGGETDESTENVQEILVEQGQMQITNEPNKLTIYGENYVCRTCLTLTDSEKCKKLFDYRHAEESRKLREKLVYVADEINFKASFNAIICQKCVTLTDLTYNFKKQVKDIENRIRKKINQSIRQTNVDLNSLLDDEGSAKVSQKNDGYNYNCQDDCKDMKLESEEIGKSTTRASEMQSMENINTEATGNPVSSQGLADSGRILGKDNQHDNASCISSQSKYRNLEEYLVVRGEQLDRICAKYPAWQRVHFKTNSGNTFPIKVPDFDRILSKKVPLKKSGESLDAVDNNTVRDCMLNQDGLLRLNRETIENGNSVDWDKGGESRESGGSNWDAHFLRRQGRVKKFDYTNQFSNSSFRVLKNQRRPVGGETTSKLDDDQAAGTLLSPSYLYLFNTGTITKRKPDVPKTWDLFDQEHDEYFENLVGEAGCFMVKKWSKAFQSRGIGDGPYLCENCGFFTVTKSKFYYHMDTHKTKMTMCSYCGKLVRGGQHLKRHIELKHTQPSYECKHCGKKFHWSTNLAAHISRLHNGRNCMVQCQLCGKFIRNWSLRNHMSRHNNKVFTCDVCNRSFYCKNNLHRHRSRHSSNERYPCSSCPKTYKSKSTLRQHTFQIHERLWEWSCEICDRLFSRKEHLKRHTRVVHGSILLDQNKQEMAEKQDEKCDEKAASPEVMEVNLRTTEQTQNVIVYKNDEAQRYYIF